MSTLNSIVAVYNTHEQAEAAMKELQEAGVDMHSLSIAGKDTHADEHVVGYYNTGDRMKYWGKLERFGEASGDCCSALQSLPFLALDLSSWPDLSWRGSWLAWKEQTWLVVSVQ